MIWTVVTVAVALVLGLPTLYLTFRSTVSAESDTDLIASEAARRPGLRAVSMSAYMSGPVVDGKETEVGVPDKPVTGLRGPVVDVLVDNRAPGPAIITQIRLEVVEAGTIDECRGTGGPLGWSRDYDIKVPHPLPSTPLTIVTDIEEPLSVPANETDRFLLLVGPEEPEPQSIWYSVFDAWILQPDLKDVPIGRVAVVTTGSSAGIYLADDESSQWVDTITYRNPDGTWIDGTQECLAEQSATVKRVLAMEDTVFQKELVTLGELLAAKGF
ncbi:hypothetical protein ACQEVI_20770 [Promicromonospora sp. CA-289599]|uniref:hypothetical protein n=1 Tax=Promicromonospora sp. CA-289599 TaxID=3240014 RepID=UPI003D8A30C2